MYMYPPRTCLIGPKGLPIVGSLLFDITRNMSKAGDEGYFHKLLLNYGPIVKVMVMGESIYILMGEYLCL